MHGDVAATSTKGVDMHGKKGRQEVDGGFAGGMGWMDGEDSGTGGFRLRDRSRGFRDGPVRLPQRMAGAEQFPIDRNCPEERPEGCGGE